MGRYAAAAVASLLCRRRAAGVIDAHAQAQLAHARRTLQGLLAGGRLWAHQWQRPRGARAPLRVEKRHGQLGLLAVREAWVQHGACHVSIGFCPQLHALA